RNGELERIGVGEPDILGGHGYSPAEEGERVLASFDHAGHPVEGAIGVGTAERLVVGGEHIVMLFPAPVVVREAELHCLSYYFEVDRAALAHVGGRGLEDREG